MKKVLITGSNGFIGKHLIQTLEEKDVEIVKFDKSSGKNIVNNKDFADLAKTDTVFHLAAVSGYKNSKESAFLAYKVNIMGTINVLEYCRENKAKIIFPSTYVYAEPYEKIKKETDIVKPTTNYSYTKYLGEQNCQFYSRIYGVDSLILRTSNVYGRGQEGKYIVPIVTDHILNNEELTLTKENVERSFIYIDDLIKAYIKLAEAKTKPREIYNVGPDKATSLKELVELISKLAGKQAKIKYSGVSRPDEVDINRIDNSKTKNKIGWQPKISLEEGLKRYLISKSKRA